MDTVLRHFFLYVEKQELTENVTVTDDLLMYLLVQLFLLVTLNKGRIYQYLGQKCLL